MNLPGGRLVRRLTLAAAALIAVPALFAASGSSAPAAAPPDLDRIVRLWAAATGGGLDRMRALRSVRMTGRITFRDQSPCPIEVEVARPARIRTRVTFPAGAWIQVWDGHDGWTISPFAGNREPTPMTAEQRRNAPEQADLDGPLVDPEKKGIRLVLEGRAVVDGKDAWRIRVTRPDGVVRFLDIDAATSLKLRWEGELGEGENRKMNASLFSDYRPVDGYAFPFRIVSGVLGGPSAQEIAFDRVEIDPAIPDSDFERPR